jgi:hypothetical protein
LLQREAGNPGFFRYMALALIAADRKDDGIKLMEDALRNNENKHLRGLLIEQKYGKVILFEFNGLGLKYDRPIPGFRGVSIRESDRMLQDLAIKCVEQQGIIRVEDFCREAATDVEGIDKMLKRVAREKGIQGYFAEANGLFFIWFERIDS